MFKRFLIFCLLFVLIVTIFSFQINKVNTALATDSGKIAFESASSADPVDDNIWVMNPDGTGLTQLTISNDYDGVPSWSPDRTKIVFESWRAANRNPDIYIMDSDGNNQTNLTNNPASDKAPALSPLGDKIAFHSNRSGVYEIYTMDIGGGNAQQLTTGGGLEPAWNHDGTKIAYESNNEIWVMNASGGGQQQLTNNSALDSWPAWSPNGNKIAFVSERDGNREIYIMNSDGAGTQDNLSRSATVDSYPAWSPDGSKIIFESHRDGNYELYQMNPDGSMQTRFTMNPGNDEAPAWSSTSTPPTTGSTVALLHFDGPNGGQDFHDETEKIWELASGSAAISDVQTKTNFGQSLYLPGVTYLRTPFTQDFDFQAGDFTIEWWEYRLYLNYPVQIMQFSYTGSYLASMYIGVDAYGIPVFCASSGPNDNRDIANSRSMGSGITNQWVHRAVVRSGNNFYTFENGQIVETWTSNLAINSNCDYVVIGSHVYYYAVDAYIDELRISSVARWTSNFTPPTLPY